MLFDIRELALLGWVGLLVVFALIHPTGRSLLLGFAKALLKLPHLIVLLLMTAHVAGLVYLMSWVGLWVPALVSETVLWFLGPAVILLSRFDKAGKDPAFLRAALLSVLKYTVVVEFVMNLRPADLLIELLLVPILVFVTLLHLVASLKTEHRSVQVFMEILLAILGFSLFLYTVIGVIQDPETFATLDNFREFLLPILLTIGFIPFVYLFALYTMYEAMFLRLNGRLDDPKLRHYSKRRAVRAAHLRLSTLRRFAAGYPNRLAGANERADVDRVARELKLGN